MGLGIRDQDDWVEEECKDSGRMIVQECVLVCKKPVNEGDVLG